MAPSIGPGAARHPISQQQQHNALESPPSASPKRRAFSSLDPDAPEFASPSAVSTQGKLAQLICHRIHMDTLNVLTGGPSRDYIHSLIDAKQAERKTRLQWFTSIKAQLDGAREKIARVVPRSALYSESHDTDLNLDATSYDLMERRS